MNYADTDSLNDMRGEVLSLVSVVLSVHDDAFLQPSAASPKADLALSLESVVGQSYANWELYVVGEDLSEAARVSVNLLVDSLQDERVHYEHLEPDPTRRSASAIPGLDAKRRGVQRSRGELLVFLEAGAAFEQQHLDRCVQIFAETESELDLIYSDSRVVYTGSTGEGDPLQVALASPYRLLSAWLGERTVAPLKEELSSLNPLAPLAGLPYVSRKPAWNSEAADKLERSCFLELSDVILTRDAYIASGGLRKLSPIAWSLWHNLLRSGRNRFRHVPQIGISYFVHDLVRVRQQFASGILGNLNLPLHAAPPGGRSTSHVHPANTVTPQRRHPLGKKRLLFIGEATALSHVARPATLARYLCEKGYDICFVRDPRFSKLLDERGLETVDLKSLPSSLVQGRLARHEPIHDADTLDRYTREDLRIIENFEPDLVIGDQRHSLAISTRLAKVRYLNIADAHWSTAVDLEYDLPNSPISGIVGMPLSNLLFQFAQPLAFAYQSLPVNAVRIKHGLPAIKTDIRECYTYGDYTLFPNDPALFPLKKPLPANHAFLGPIPWSPVIEKPIWWDQIPPHLPLLYVSLGSTGASTLLPTLLRVISQLPVAAVVAKAGHSDLTSVSSNIFITDFLPGAEVVARATLVVCNGGTMSGQQALSAGVPYLGLISNLDQMLFSTLVRKASACELLREGDVNDVSLRAALLKMLEQERYQIAAKKLAAGVATIDPFTRFEAIVHSLLEDKASYATPDVRTACAS